MNDTIGVQEKRELAKIISEDFDNTISQMQQEINFTEGEILEQAKNKFGIKAINMQVNQLQQRIRLLENQKKDLGFGYDDKFKTSYTKDSVCIVDMNTKAGNYYYLKAGKHADIRALKVQKASRLKELWLADIRSEVKRISNQAISISVITHKK